MVPRLHFQQKFQFSRTQTQTRIQTQIQTRIQTQIQIQTQIHKLNSKSPGKVLTVNVGQYKLEMIIEWYQGFISTKKISF